MAVLIGESGAGHLAAAREIRHTRAIADNRDNIETVIGPDDRRPEGVLNYVSLRLLIHTRLRQANDVILRWVVQSELDGMPK